VKLVKFRAAKIIEQRGVPLVLWDHVLEYCAQLNNRLYHAIPRLEGRTPYELVHGYTPDLSSFVDFEFYQLIWYVVMPVPLFPHPRRNIGRWLGPSKTIMPDLVFKILTKTGHVIYTSAVESVTQADLDIENVREMVTDYDRLLMKKLGLGPSPTEDDIYRTLGLPLIKDEEGRPSTGRLDSEILHSSVSVVSGSKRKEDFRGADIALEGSGDGSNLAASWRNDDVPPDSSPNGHGWESAKVKIGNRRGVVVGRKRDAEGNVIGTYNPNPILDTTLYEVAFEDGTWHEITANAIAEAIYNHSDPDGREWLSLDCILDHFKSKHVSTHPSQKSTNGWFLLVRWKDGSEDVVRLRDIKESYPVDVAKYAVNNKIDREPGFAYWVPYVLKKQARMISKVTARNVRHEKYGLKVPRSVEEAYRLDAESGTSYWRDAIDKEMKNVAVAFDIQPKGKKAPPGYQMIRCHIVFDIKMDGTRKARYVAGGHLAEPLPSSITYSTVVARDSIRILLVIAALNDLDILATDLQNAYLSAKPRERVWFIAGKEFGSQAGCVVVVVRALYGLRSSGAAFRAKLAQDLREFGYFSSLADPDVWMKARTKANGQTYYEYLLIYVDDVLCISEKPSEFMLKLQSIYTLKNGFAPPKSFLGVDIHPYEVHKHGQVQRCYGMSSESYLRRIITDLEQRSHLPPQAVAPLPSNYYPELDVSSLLNESDINFYQGLIGTLRWIVEIGRMDIAHGVSVLSSFLVQPRQGHLTAALHIFAYLKSTISHTLVLDAEDFKPPKHTPSCSSSDWREFYPEASEPLPNNAPKPRGRSVTTSIFVDADHARDQQTRRSHSGIVLYVQNSPVIWYSKRQSTVESSTHGAELIAARIGVELVEALRYKLRMFGIPVDEPTSLYCDNQSVVHNGTRPESTLKKKHNSIAFHKLREAVAADYIRLYKVPSDLNVADLLTKPLSGVATKSLRSCLLK